MPANPNQHQVAYVFAATGWALQGFSLPAENTATTPQSGGQLGYGYTMVTSPGNATVYAYAGIQDDSTSPATFEPYVMGVARGVPVKPNAKTVGVDIQMTSLLDRSLSVAPQMPPQGGRGPDRMVTTVAIDLGAGAYAVLPQGTVTRLLPISGTIDFVGVPALDGMLVGSRYDLTAAAVTGTGQQDPTSEVAYIETTDANDPLSIGGFFAIPSLVQPGITPWSGTHVQMQASGPIDLALLQVSTGSGLVTWTIVSPGNLSFDLPDISQVSGVDSLVRGPLTTTFDIAQIAGFDYGTVRTGQLSSSSWNAYAEDTSTGSY
jgi:hypothetical protein